MTVAPYASEYVHFLVSRIILSVSAKISECEGKKIKKGLLNRGFPSRSKKC